MARDIG